MVPLEQTIEISQNISNNLKQATRSFEKQDNFALFSFLFWKSVILCQATSANVTANLNQEKQASILQQAVTFKI